MEVIRASVMGFCMGVKRAVENAEQALSDKDSDENGGRRVYSLGPLIHNPTVLSDFTERGLSVISPDDISSDLKDASVIIRAHGTTPLVMKKLEEAGAKVIDATCPKVHLSQRRAMEWSRKGYDIVIAGDRNHGEVTSISSFADFSAADATPASTAVATVAATDAGTPAFKGQVHVVQSVEEAQGLSLSDKAVLIAQTTFSPLEFERIRDVLKEKNPDIVVFNSICSATMERQNALKDLAGKVDGIIVIGGKSSANTRRLYESARKLVPYADLIEDASMIKKEFFPLERVGITAGASTPEAVVRSVEEVLLGSIGA